MTYGKKIAIIGGGVAGLSAAVYALRANAEVTLFEQFGLGGLTATIDKIENFPSYLSVEGWQLAQNMAEQASALGLKTVYGKVLSLERGKDGFVIKTEKETYDFISVVVATGTKHNKLGIESGYAGKGVSYCATCDGNFYRNRPVAVAGGGNAAVKEALYLAEVASEVYVVNPSESFKSDAMSAERLLSYPNVKVLYGFTVAALEGKDKLEKIRVFNGTETETLNVDALFVAVGAAPSTEFIKIPDLNTRNGYITVNAAMSSSVSGLYAAGDVADGTLKQIVTACADGAKAGSFAAAYAAAAVKAAAK